MLAGFPFRRAEFNDEWMSGSMLETLVSVWRWNQWLQYASNWTIALRALRQLWETGKVTKLGTPYFERFEKSEPGPV
jgi:hypothetical protein